jgi:hypothetical protein
MLDMVLNFPHALNLLLKFRNLVLLSERACFFQKTRDMALVIPKAF